MSFQSRREKELQYGHGIKTTKQRIARVMHVTQRMIAILVRQHLDVIGAPLMNRVMQKDQYMVVSTVKRAHIIKQITLVPLIIVVQNVL
jgi:hypothetical protein